MGDICELPTYQGPFHAAFFNAVFGNVADQRAALLAGALQLRPGGHLVISHPLGRAWLQVRVKVLGRKAAGVGLGLMARLSRALAAAAKWAPRHQLPPGARLAAGEG